MDSRVVNSRNVAPSKTALCSKMESSLLRFIAIKGVGIEADRERARRILSTGMLNTLPDRAEIFTWSMTSELPATSLSMPSRLKKAQERGLMQSPQIFSRGNAALSHRSTLTPFRASNAAHEEPAGPAPIIATSKWVSANIIIDRTCRKREPH